MSDIDCVFCKIVRKEAAASVIYEDTQVLAFMDIRPVSEGHTLIIPKKHYVDIYDTPEELVCYTHKITKRIATAVKKATNADGISIVQQNGKAAGQDIFHLHVHVIPRFEGQNIPHFHELTVMSREKLDQAAANIRKHL
jgi:histidine triad (HIT) family protein